jgi:molybdopterin converting factor small subunit
MIVRVQLFAAARDLAGAGSIELELPSDATIAVLRRELIARVPALAPLDQHLLFAVDAEYASAETKIPPGATIACIPPVSGG